MHFDYTEAPYQIREDIGEAHRAFWLKLASPGNWWTGPERVDIAQEVRNALHCDYCQERKAALSPYKYGGEHVTQTSLDRLAVDAVHRIVTDQERITATWIESNAAEGFSKEKYVELAGIVVSLFSIDEFHRALGMPLEPLPLPESGEPSRYRPENLDETTGFVPMIAKDKVGENEKDLWPPGFGANVVRALSLVPDACRDWREIAGAQYLSFAEMAIMDQPNNRSINRMQMELIAGRVSAINQCFY